MVAINIRGTGGSGKSYLVHKLLKDYKHKRIVKRIEGRKKLKTVAYYIHEFDLYVIGSYEMLSGGCDTFGGKGRTLNIIKAVEKYSKKGNVLYEGFILSGVWSAYKDLSNRLDKSLWLFMDTPIDVCIDRVLKRRRARGNDKPFNSRGINDIYRRCIRYQRYCKAESMRHEILNYKESYKQFIQILKRELAEG